MFSKIIIFLCQSFFKFHQFKVLESKYFTRLAIMTLEIINYFLFNIDFLFVVLCGAIGFVTTLLKARHEEI